MKSFTVLALLAGFGMATPPMSFDCANMPDVCTNMCWGAYCTRPAFGATLYYDNYGGTRNRDSTIGRARAKSAGCLPDPNRCSLRHKPPNPTPGQNCDEYPFASTKDADKGGQVSKCVISNNNSRQGRIIQQYTQRNCHGNPCSFIVGFGNPAAPGVKYCDAYTDPHGKCINDEGIFKNGKLDVRPPATKKRDEQSSDEPASTGGLYLMKSGMKVVFGEDLAPGTLIQHAMPSNATLALLKREANGTLALGDSYDFEAEEWTFADDVIVSKIDGNAV